ncbi:hypothetical protein [Kitasatospora sp. LaBMicrA B282]|uniref:hypothetical protein n=1 Tax=Kitasatospora sp. LaBMicrA B282 TaxID=3420949 RepID=UPI003D12D854
MTDSTPAGPTPAEPPAQRPASEPCAEPAEPEVVLHAADEDAEERPWCIGDLTV